jgi:2-amino-4-hydroxy-6-hydroxymethyldihydropteridine diphosphokinase
VKEKYTKNIFLSLGSNLGDRLLNIYNCLKLIEEEIGTIEKKSSVYETEAWGNRIQKSFLNMVIQIHSPQSPFEMLESIHKIESKLGRIRNEKWEPRVIDIDILYFDAAKVNTQHLTIPHLFMQDRKFVLVPLVEIDPKFEHPILKKNNSALLSECKDQSEVKVFKD